LPSLQRYRDLLGEGVVGKVLSVRCEIGQYLPSWRLDSDYRQGVSARHELGGGVLLELSHELDYLRWIFGEVDWLKASLSRQSSLEIDVEDTAHLTLGFESALDGYQLIGAVNLDFVRHDTTRLCTAIGEKGSLRWNGLTGEVLFYGVGRKEWELMFSHQHHRDDSYMAEWKNFIECVNTHKIPLITGEDGLKVLQIIEAARHSAKSGGQMVEVERRQLNKIYL
jgi:predicted dehydrogenase